jgi:hypothetical protein
MITINDQSAKLSIHRHIILIIVIGLLEADEDFSSGLVKDSNRERPTRICGVADDVSRLEQVDSIPVECCAMEGTP